MVSTLVCDEQLMFAESLAAALVREGADAAVVAQPEQAVAALAVAHADTVVLSLRSEGELDAVRRLRRSAPRSRIVCLTAGVHEQELAVEAGADEAVSRSRPLTELVTRVLADWVPLRSTPPRARAVPRRAGEALHLRFLTTREREVFELLVAARSTDSIAQEMSITTATARSYVQAVLEKLGVHSRVEAVAYAARHAVAAAGTSRCS
jgi:two-component system nitrate/nitrite response regulator NarL